MKTAIFLLLGLIYLQVSAKGSDYDVALIPDNLKKNAHIVIRNKQSEFTIHSDNRSTLKVHYAITILNEAATAKSSFKTYYNKFRRVSKIKGTVYDAQGNKVKSLKFYLEDKSAITGATLYSDARVKSIVSPYRQVPFTVEYSYEVTTNGTLEYPNFYTVDYATSIQKAEHIVNVPKDMAIKYYNQNTDITPIEKNKGSKSYHWVVENKEALKYEPLSKPKYNLLPMVKISPIDFEMDGYQGSTHTWSDFGKWIYKLNQGKSDLSEESVQEIKKLISPTNSTKENIYILYKYMQDRTRYASIQVGIGGWQPFPASIVHSNGYGDCKALTNYMKTLLEVADIPSYYTLINAGKNESLTKASEPSYHFNHALLCVPVDGRDTIWLECTSQTMPFGYLGTFTDDRNALLISEDGGHLIRTKSYTKEDNILMNKYTVDFDDQLNAYVSIHGIKQGLFFDNNQHLLFNDAVDEKREILNSLKIKDFDLIEHSVNTYIDKLPYISLELKLNLRNYCTRMDQTHFIKLNMSHRFQDVPGVSYHRNNELFIRRAYTLHDKILYKIPPNYQIKDIPRSLTIDSKFGHYNLSVQVSNNNIHYEREMSINKGTYPADEYIDYVTFLEKIAKLEESMASIEKI